MLADHIQGEINGLPTMRGYAVATNGIHVAIWNCFTRDVLFGHIHYFVPDQSSEQAVLDEATASEVKPKNKQTKKALLSEYITNI
jgi:hypothetical protein